MHPNVDVKALLDELDGRPADALESETVEFKSWNLAPAARDPELRSLRETVVCLANQQGGLIVLGVADAKRTRREAIRGVGDVDILDLRRAIYDGTDPHVLVEIEEMNVPEGRVLAIRVPRGLPPHTTTEGIGKVRIGKDCKPLTGSQLTQLLARGGRRDLSAEIVPEIGVADLDLRQIDDLRRHLERSAGKSDLARLRTPELLENLELVSRHGVTLAAVLLLGSKDLLRRFVPQHEIIFAHFSTQTHYDARHDLRGPLLATLDRLEDLLQVHLQVTSAAASGFVQMELPDLTWTVAREAVLNAVVHRDYFFTESVHVELHPGRFEVTSPGGFIGGVRSDNVLRHPPVRRNVLLAETLQTLGLVERAGLGVDRIYLELLRMGKGMPRYHSDEAHVRLVVPTRTNAEFAGFVAAEAREGRDLELDDLILLRAAVDQGSLDRWSASGFLQLDEEEAAPRLSSLRKRGFLMAQGRGRGTSYRLARRLSDRLRGPAATNREMPLEDEAVRLRVQHVLRERGRLSNEEIRQLSGYDRRRVLALMRAFREEGLAELRGRGRGAHYVPGPELREED